MNDDSRQPEISKRPTAVHYALVISVCINVVLALAWSISWNDKAYWKHRAKSLAAEVSALKNAADGQKKSAQ